MSTFDWDSSLSDQNLFSFQTHIWSHKYLCPACHMYIQAVELMVINGNGFWSIKNNSYSWSNQVAAQTTSKGFADASWCFPSHLKVCKLVVEVCTIRFFWFLQQDFNNSLFTTHLPNRLRVEDERLERFDAITGFYNRQKIRLNQCYNGFHNH